MSLEKSNLNLRIESESIRKLHPDKIPIILSTDKDGPVLKNNKFLVPLELTVGHFIHVVRKRLKIDSTVGLFFIINNQLVACSKTMYDIDKEYRNDNGFVYGNIVFEKTFG